MQRFTIFTVFFFIIVAIVAIEISFSDFGKKPRETSQAQTVSVNISSPHPLLDSNKPSADFSLTEALLTKSGFQTVSLEPLTPERTLFSLVTLPQTAPSSYNKFAVFEDSKVNGVLYEIPFLTLTDAAETYHALKKTASLLPEYSVNETNQYGEASFYINHLPPLPRVLLISRIGITLFGFEYPPETHEKIRSLLSELTLTVQK